MFKTIDSDEAIDDWKINYIERKFNCCLIMLCVLESWEIKLLVLELIWRIFFFCYNSFFWDILVFVSKIFAESEWLLFRSAHKTLFCFAVFRVMDYQNVNNWNKNKSHKIFSKLSWYFFQLILRNFEKNPWSILNHFFPDKKLPKLF